MKARLLLAAAAALGLCGAAHAAAPAKKPASPCFFSQDWTGWRAPDSHTIYLRVNVGDIYKIELSSGSDLLTWPDTHLINDVHGVDSVCAPIDLDLKISAGHFVEPLFVKSLTKLTPQQVAMIPKKDLP